MRDLDEWLAEVRQGAGQGAGSTLQRPEVLHMRGEGGRGAQLRFFAYHNLSFAREAPLTFPHFMQQQSEMRWVRETLTLTPPSPSPFTLSLSLSLSLTLSLSLSLSLSLKP